MALYHFHVGQVKRSAGQSVVESAAYRAGERLYSERYGEYSDYTRKGGVVYTEILLPPNAPREYADRQTLWNAVEAAERGKNAQLAYSFDIALLDPPYHQELIPAVLPALVERMSARGIIICEHAADEHLPEECGSYAVAKRHKFGKIMLSVYRRTASAAQERNDSK